MRRGMLLCTVVVLAAVVGMPGVASAGGGCHGGVTENDATGQEDATIEMVDACFTATVTTVDPGAPVTFVNMDEFVHNVGGNQWGHFEDLHGGDTFRVSFDEAGTYPFACSYHPGMTGAIVVGDGKGAGSGARGRAVRGTGSRDRDARGHSERERLGSSRRRRRDHRRAARSRDHRGVDPFDVEEVAGPSA